MTTTDQQLAARAAERGRRRYGSNSGMSGRIVHHVPADVTPAYLAELIGIRGPVTLTQSTGEHADDCAQYDGPGECDCTARDQAAILVDLTDTDGTPRVFVIEIREVS